MAIRKVYKAVLALIGEIRKLQLEPDNPERLKGKGREA